MRVLLISHALVTRSNHRLPEELSRYPDVELQVLAPQWWPEESRVVYQEKTGDARYRVRQGRAAFIGQPAPNLFLYRAGLARALREFQPDLLDVQEEPFSLAMGQILATRQLFAPQAKLLFYSFQNIVKRYPPPFRIFERRAFAVAVAACAATEEIAGVLRHKGYAGRIDISPPGVDPQVFRRVPADAAQLRCELGLAERQPLLGYLGRLTPEKGIEDAVAMLSLLPDEVRLLLVGGGERAAVEAHATRLGVRERLLFAGPINRLETPRYLSALDALLVPSRTTPRWKEQFGRVIIEAAMCGVPVIGSDSGAIPEVLGPGGLVVPEGNPRALAAAARLLLDQPALAAEFGQRGRERALQQFTWERIAAARYALYREVCGRS